MNSPGHPEEQAGSPPKTRHTFLLKLLSLPGFHYAASRFMGKAIAKLAFDAKFSGARGDWIKVQEPPEFIAPLEKYASSLGDGAARILILGCGTADLIEKLSPSCFRSIIGIDLSAKAIEIARRKWASERIRFEVADMCAYKPPAPQNIVILSESIYYLDKKASSRLIATLRRENPEVVFFITIAQPDRYRDYLTDIRANSPAILEDRPLVPAKPRHLLVFM